MPSSRLVTIALVVVCQIAHAQGASMDDPDTERARHLYQEGAKFYDAGQYPQAIEKFEEARALKAAPGLDYNIARSHDRLGNTEKALDEYKRYLASQPPDGDVVAARISVLEQRLAKQNSQKVATPPPAQPQPAKKSRTWVYAVAGVTVAVVVGVAVGVGVGLGAQPSDPHAPLGAIHW